MFMPRLYKDTSAEAFIADDNPAVVYRKVVEETFGLADPIIVAITSDDPAGIFTARGLNYVSKLTKQIRRLEGVDPERVTSLATENNIIGDEIGLEVSPFYEDKLESDDEAVYVKEQVFRFPLYMGSLVASDGSSTLIVAELMDPDLGNEVFHKILEFAEAQPEEGIEVAVAGEGAVAEVLGEYIDTDSARLYPFLGLVVISILLIAYRTPRGIFLPLFIVIGAVVIAMGTMALSGYPIYLVTNALPVILIAIGVADGIHIVGEYYEEIALRPYAQKRQPIVRAMSQLWGAILFTSVTDAAGFTALALVSFMPPMRAFGIFAAVGVIAAGAFSLLVLPAMLMLLPMKPSGAFRERQRKGKGEHFDRFGITMGYVGRFVVRAPKVVLAVSLLLAIAGVVGAAKLEINYARIKYFHEDEPIYKADKVINERFDGSNFIDVVIDAQEPDGLLNADRLKKIEALQTFVEGLDHVGGTTSVVDYVKQINRALNEDDESFYVLPDDDMLIAQFFLLFSATGDPEQLNKVIDYDYRLANVRIALNDGSYQDIKEVIEPLTEYLDAEFSDAALTASVAGRANVTYHWIESLSRSHFIGVGVALLAVWLCAALSFRSFSAATFAVIPVILSILCIYAVMGATGIWLGVGTSMFAAIGIGISVNFAIHTLHRTIELVRDYEEDISVAMTQLFPSTGRALFFNFASMFFGFSVLMTSQVNALNEFGFLVAVATLISFVASITTLPALLLAFRPGFLTPSRKKAKTAEELKIVTEEW